MVGPDPDPEFGKKTHICCSYSPEGNTKNDKKAHIKNVKPKSKKNLKPKSKKNLKPKSKKG